nr:hypothetical protein SHINE37_43080 [Rhizobiaceae bacterium]
MMMATGGVSVVSKASFPLSGDDIGDDLVFQLGDLVLEDQLLLLHALDSEGFAADLDHGVDRGIVVFVLLAQPCNGKPQFSLFLVCHAISFPVVGGAAEPRSSSLYEGCSYHETPGNGKLSLATFSPSTNEK